MKILFKKFIISNIILTAILAVIWLILFFFIAKAILSPAIPFLFIFFFLIASAIYYIMMLSAGNKFSKFINTFMIITVGKMLFFAIIIVVYIFLNKSDAWPFTISFFIFYLIYTVFEITAFLRDVKKTEKQDKVNQ
jgi:hypothetical protein